MAGYQHYSFDLWLTLIRSHPSFKDERTRYFYCNFNRQNKSIEEVARIFRQVDVLCNAINEKTGGNIDAEEMYLMVIGWMNDGPEVLADTDIDGVYRDLEQLVMTYPPVVYSADTLPVLDQLASRGDCTRSILSNTGFIKGRTLRPVLDALGIGQYLDFQLYSDEIGMSKPHPGAFGTMLERASGLRKSRVLTPDNVLHVGDNPQADGAGARASGIPHLLINSNSASITSLLSHDFVFAS